MKKITFILTILAFSLSNNLKADWGISGATNTCANLSGDCINQPTYTYSLIGNPIPGTTILTVDWHLLGGLECSNDLFDYSIYKVKWDNDECSSNTHKVSVSSITIYKTNYISCGSGTLYQTEKWIYGYTSSNSTDNHYNSSGCIDFITHYVNMNEISLSPTVAKIGSISSLNMPTSIYKYNQTPITYSIYGVCSASNYTWTIPSGWSATTSLSGPTCTSITVIPSLTGAGTINVVACNNNGCNLCVSKSVSVARPLLPLSPIVGPDAICSYKSMKYTVPANSYFTNYVWTVPSGWIINGQGSNTIYITPPSSTYSGGGTITVKGSDGIDFTPQQQKIVGIGIPTPITYTVVTSANIENTYSINYMLGSTLYKSNSNTTNSVWSTTNAVFHYFWPMSGTDEFYFKSVNTCGASPVKKIIMHGNPCPGCPVEY